MKLEHIQGVIFDMDNTLLQSRIDFSAMRLEIYQYLVKLNVLSSHMDLNSYTSSTLIDIAKQNNLSVFHEKKLWSIAAKHELLGMENAGLEAGATEVLHELQHRYKLVILTNNAQSAAEKALLETGIIQYFDLIVGRERMSSLKPSPSGVCFILDNYPKLNCDMWLLIGDSWIDGKAAEAAGVRFISYQTSIEDMNNREVYPIAKIDHLMDVLKML